LKPNHGIRASAVPAQTISGRRHIPNTHRRPQLLPTPGINGQPPLLPTPPYTTTLSNNNRRSLLPTPSQARNTAPTAVSTSSNSSSLPKPSSSSSTTSTAPAEPSTSQTGQAPAPSNSQASVPSHTSSTSNTDQAPTNTKTGKGKGPGPVKTTANKQAPPKEPIPSTSSNSENTNTRTVKPTSNNKAPPKPTPSDHHTSDTSLDSSLSSALPSNSHCKKNKKHKRKHNSRCTSPPVFKLTEEDLLKLVKNIAVSFAEVCGKQIPTNNIENTIANTLKELRESKQMPPPPSIPSATSTPLDTNTKEKRINKALSLVASIGNNTTTDVFESLLSDYSTSDTSVSQQHKQ
ncbi:MAG: hypothetical protein AAFO91_00425, partial [Bacteroidota bacterium]